MWAFGRKAENSVLQTSWQDRVRVTYAFVSHVFANWYLRAVPCDKRPRSLPRVHHARRHQVSSVHRSPYELPGLQTNLQRRRTLSGELRKVSHIELCQERRFTGTFQIRIQSSEHEPSRKRDQFGQGFALRYTSCKRGCYTSIPETSENSTIIQRNSIRIVTYFRSEH